MEYFLKSAFLGHFRFILISKCVSKNDPEIVIFQDFAKQN